MIDISDRYHRAIREVNLVWFYRATADEIYTARLDAQRVQDAVANVTLPLNELARELGRVTWELGKLSWMSQPTTTEETETQETETSE